MTNLKTQTAQHALASVENAALSKAEWCNRFYSELYDFCCVNGIFEESIFDCQSTILDQFNRDNEGDWSNGRGIEE